jgi:hypothetical protein
MLRRNQVPRRGMILLVVLSMLTLFAIVGITFVMYASSAADSARISRDSETALRVDFEPEQAMAYFLNQFVFDSSDVDAGGMGSAMRGHSLLRSMYGYNSDTGANLKPFSGTGRLHYVHQAGPLAGKDDWALPNYTFFLADGFVRDPERYGTRPPNQAPSPATNPWVGGYNVSYTYPDLNNLFLGAVRADGTVLAHSFHRLYTGFGSLDPNNPNWLNTTDATMKYRVLRPRPAEHPNFPFPEDAGGDVKNRPGTPGYLDPVSGRVCNNDSFWMDLGMPVMTAPDGRKFKVLFAPLIIDLDGRVNLNVHGNIRGQNQTHRSNQGWGAWAVNLGPINDTTGTPYSGVLTAANAGGQPEWPALFVGNGGSLLGKYGPDGGPTRIPQNYAVGALKPHAYAQVDYDESTSAGGVSDGTVTQRYALPTGVNPWPIFPAGYGNGDVATEWPNNPLLYNVWTPFPPNPPQTPPQFDRRFSITNMERLLRFGDANSPALVSELELLLPNNFNDRSSPQGVAASARRRGMVTTHSADRDQPGLTPWVWDPSAAATAYGYPATGANYADAPAGQPIPFPQLVAATMPPNPPPSGATWSSEFTADWRDAIANAVGRMDLAVALTPFPSMDPQVRFDSTAASTLPDGTVTTVAQQYQLAMADRQAFANQIYRRLLAVTGVAPVAAPATPTDAELAPRRWLAQLAVNIVDYIDEDNISTPFNFYNGSDAGDPAFDIGANNGSAELPKYWVFGTELPKLVVNEVLTESFDPMMAGVAPTVKVWVELMNTMPTSNNIPAAAQQADASPVALGVGPVQPAGNGLTAGSANPYSAYQVVLAPGLYAQKANENVLGAPLAVRGGTSTDPTTGEFILGQADTVNGGKQPGAAGAPALPYVPAQDYAALAAVPAPAPTGQGFFLLGPPTATDPQFTDPFKSVTNMGAVPDNTPVIRSKGFLYTFDPVNDTAANGMAVLLRRLAIPHLPPDPNPTTKDPAGNVIPNPFYNPYVTVDYIDQVPFRTTANPDTGGYASRGKKQPYAGRTLVAAPTPPALPDPTKLDPTSPVADETTLDASTKLSHTFGLTNVPAPANKRYDWLVHLDRQLISPMELLQVSGYQPYQLTQQFMLADLDDATRVTPATNMAKVFAHRAPWLDQTRRLYRLFELLTTRDVATGNSDRLRLTGQLTGKINVNTIWDEEVFQALCDANPSNWVSDPKLVTLIYKNMITQRSPGGYPGPVDLDPTTIQALNAALQPAPAAGVTPLQLNRPFLGMGTGYSAAAAGTQTPNARGINDTLLRTLDPPGGNDPNGNLPIAPRLFQSPLDNTLPTATPPGPGFVHPYTQMELLTKIYPRLTTRSNVFAVWVTVGFFEVEDETTTPPRLGREIGKAEGRHIRHRMFAIVDRSVWGPPVQPLGNTGPRTRFDPRSIPALVPHFSIID